MNRKDSVSDGSNAIQLNCKQQCTSSLQYGATSISYGIFVLCGLGHILYLSKGNGKQLLLDSNTPVYKNSIFHRGKCETVIYYLPKTEVGRGQYHQVLLTFSTQCNNLWSETIRRPKMIVRSGATFILIWSRFKQQYILLCQGKSQLF